MEGACTHGCSASTYDQPPVLLELHGVVVHSDLQLAQPVAPVLLVAVLISVLIFVAISAVALFFTTVVALVDLCIDALHINILEVLRQVSGPDQHVGVLAFEAVLQLIKGGVLGVSGYATIPETCRDAWRRS